jgi:hypothetical protein
MSDAAVMLTKNTKQLDELSLESIQMGKQSNQLTPNFLDE